MIGFLFCLSMWFASLQIMMCELQNLRHCSYTEFALSIMYLFILGGSSPDSLMDSGNAGEHDNHVSTFH